MLLLEGSKSLIAAQRVSTSVSVRAFTMILIPSGGRIVIVSVISTGLLYLMLLRPIELMI